MKTEEALLIAESIITRRVEALPPAKLSAFEPKAQGGDEETAVLLLSDMQIGHLTPTTTTRVVRNRAMRLAERIVKIVEIHRQAFPINRLAIFALGDIVHNDRVGRTVSLDELEQVVMEQVFASAVPTLTDFLLSLQPHFAKIDVYTVDGNHGSLGRYSAVKTNWDNVVYRTLALRLAEQPRISFTIAKDSFYQKVSIYKWTFLLAHGDQIPMHLTLPWYGLTTRAMRWQGSLPGKKFHYLTIGHFHVCSSLDWNELEIFVNGAFITDDQWVYKKYGLSNSTSQWLFGVHPRQGISFRYKVRLD